jgi:AcrR family transcriptional regulator
VVQRARILAAAIAAAADGGYANMTVGRVISIARVSRKTFYEIFADRHECFLAACEHALAEATAVAREAYDGEATWRRGVRAALTRLLALIDEEPSTGYLLVVEPLVAGGGVVRRRAQVLDVLAGVVDRGRPQASVAYPPPLTAQLLVGGVLAVIHAHLVSKPREPLGELVGPLMSMIVAPYLGARAARCELAAPVSLGRRPARKSRRARDAGPLEGLKMRLTYRTVRVLMFIGSNPGMSNREIGEGSGIDDPGQVSKLLGRLARLNLVENLGHGQPAGAPNDWRLTPLGVQLERATGPH